MCTASVREEKVRESPFPWRLVVEQSRSSWNVEQGRERAECGHLGGGFPVHVQWAEAGRSGGNLLGRGRSLGQGGSRAFGFGAAGWAATEQTEFLLGSLLGERWGNSPEKGCTSAPVPDEW